MAALYGGDGYALDGEREHVTVARLRRLLENVNPTIDSCVALLK